MPQFELRMKTGDIAGPFGTEDEARTAAPDARKWEPDGQGGFHGWRDPHESGDPDFTVTRISEEDVPV